MNRGWKTLSDTVKGSQGGTEICNGRALAKWGKNGGVRVRGYFTQCWCAKWIRSPLRFSHSVRNGFWVCKMKFKGLKTGSS